MLIEVLIDQQINITGSIANEGRLGRANSYHNWSSNIIDWVCNLLIDDTNVIFI